MGHLQPVSAPQLPSGLSPAQGPAASRLYRAAMRRDADQQDRLVPTAPLHADERHSTHVPSRERKGRRTEAGGVGAAAALPRAPGRADHPRRLLCQVHPEEASAIPLLPDGPRWQLPRVHPATRARVKAGHEECVECEEQRGMHHGDPSVSRRQSWSSRLVAEALRDLSAGASYSMPGRRLRKTTEVPEGRPCASLP